MSTSIAAVVLNWRDAESTRECVKSLLQDPAITSVVVVDNESTGELRDLRGVATLIENAANLGFAGGVNTGIRGALSRGADAILAINNDAVLQPGAAGVLKHAWLDCEVEPAMLAPRILDPDGADQSTGGRFRAFDASTRDLRSRHVNYLTWACVLVPRSTFADFGLLDERFFMYWEDVDFGLRLTDGGKRLLVVKDATVLHGKSRSHGRAGVKIDRYSAHGLVLLCLERGGWAMWLGLPYRLTRRLGARVFRAQSFHAVLQGVGDGIRAYRQGAGGPRSLQLVAGEQAHDR